MQLGLFSSVFRLIRLGPFLKRNAKLLFATTDDDIARANLLLPFEFHIDGYPWAIMVMVITLLFAITLPITVGFGLIYFLMHYLTTKHLLIYHYPSTTITQKAGKMYADAYKAVYIVLLL